MPKLPSQIAFHTDARAWGGAEVYLTQLLESVRAAGIEPHVYCADRPRAADWLKDLRQRGFAVTVFRPSKEFSVPGFFAARKLLAGYDVVHFNKTNPRNCLCAIAGAGSVGTKVIVATEHLASPPVSHVPFGRSIITLLVRMTNRLIDRTIAVSEVSRRMLMENYRISPNRIVTIRNGIDLARFDAEFDVDAVKSELGLEPEDRVAVLIGAFVARKGHRYALRAAQTILEQIPTFKLVLVGGGSLEAELRAESDELGVSRAVVFAGFRRDVPAVLAASDVLLLPSEDECLPLVILEAMASGLPVVATDVGGISEVVKHEVTGRLIEPGDPRQLSDALIEILSDPDRARAMGRAGRAWIETGASAEACTGAVLRLYEHLLEENRRGKGRATAGVRADLAGQRRSQD